MVLLAVIFLGERLSGRSCWASADPRPVGLPRLLAAMSPSEPTHVLTVGKPVADGFSR